MLAKDGQWWLMVRCAECRDTASAEWHCISSTDIDNEAKRDAVYRRHGKQLEKAPMEAMRVARTPIPIQMSTHRGHQALATGPPGSPG